MFRARGKTAGSSSAGFVGEAATSWKGLPSWVLADAGVWLEGGLVVVPYRTSAGELYADRVIAGSGRRWWSPGDGRPVIPFGLDRLERLAFRRYRALAICEGESDALALSAAFKGDGVDVLGVPGAGTWKPEWAVHAVGYSAVYVAGDGDAAGRTLDAAVYRDVPGSMSLRLPDGADVRALLQADGPDAVLELIRQADWQQRVGLAFTAASSYNDLLRRLGVAETPLKLELRAAA